jgi:hypothetical protein
MPMFFDMKIYDKTPCLHTFQNDNEGQNMRDKLLVANYLQIKNLSHILILILTFVSYIIK